MQAYRLLCRSCPIVVAITVGGIMLPKFALAQDTSRTPRRDSARADSVARLKTVTIVAAPAERVQASNATHVDATTIRLTPASSAYDLLRQTAGLEVHLQGQGPGFASDASLRGFSSDHSTDLALWVDGVPINEPVNGHAEGYNDWAVLFPGGIQDIDVVRGPTSALFGNFALSGIVNVRTIERMRGTEVTASGGSFGRAEAMVLTGFDHGGDGGVLGARFQREAVGSGYGRVDEYDTRYRIAETRDDFPHRRASRPLRERIARVPIHRRDHQRSKPRADHRVGLRRRRKV
jgi:outer membrane cobalamin receptor